MNRVKYYIFSATNDPYKNTVIDNNNIIMYTESELIVGCKFPYKVGRLFGAYMQFVFSDSNKLDMSKLFAEYFEERKTKSVGTFDTYFSERGYE